MREEKEQGWGEGERERLLQRPLLFHSRLLFYGNRINRAVSSMTNQNKARTFLHDLNFNYAGRRENIHSNEYCEKIFKSCNARNSHKGLQKRKKTKERHSKK